MAEQQKQPPATWQVPDKPEDPDFWDNFVNRLLRRLLAVEQFRVHLKEKLGINLGDLDKGDVDQLIKDAKPGGGWGAVVADIVTSVPFMAIPGGPVVGGVAAGIAGSVTEPVVTEGDDYWEKKGVQAAVGGLTGAAFGVLGKLLGEPARRAPDAFNRAVINEALPPGASKVSAIGHAGIEQAQKLWDAAYDRVVPKLSVNVDSKLVSDLTKIRDGMRGSGQPQQAIDQFWNVVEARIIDVGQRSGGTLPGKAVQEIQSALRKLATGARKSDIGDELMQAREVFLDAAERSSPAAVVKEFSELRAKYPAFVAVQRAASGATTDSGVFTPNQLASAVRQTDTSINKARTAAGKAPFQDTIDAAREARVGTETTTQRLMHGLPIASGGVKMLEESAAYRAAGRAADALTVPTVGAVAPLVTQQAVPPEQPGGLSPADDIPEPEMPEIPDLDEFINERMNAPDAGSVSEPGMPELPDLDGFLNERMGEAHIDDLASSIYEQETSSGRNVRTSPAGARGPMQIMPSTFRMYAKAGEYIDNPEHNMAVGRRIIADLWNKYGDERKVAAAYFSGKPDYTSNVADVTGKRTASYVADVVQRLEERRAKRTQMTQRSAA